MYRRLRVVTCIMRASVAKSQSTSDSTRYQYSHDAFACGDRSVVLEQQDSGGSSNNRVVVVVLVVVVV